MQLIFFLYISNFYIYIYIYKWFINNIKKQNKEKIRKKALERKKTKKARDR